MKYLGLILKNLFRNKRRTALTVFSIAVSLFIFSALISMPTAMTQVLADTASSNRVITHNKSGLTYSIPLASSAEMTPSRCARYQADCSSIAPDSPKISNATRWPKLLAVDVTHA